MSGDGGISVHWFHVQFNCSSKTIRYHYAKMNSWVISYPEQSSLTIAASKISKMPKIHNWGNECDQNKKDIGKCKFHYFHLYLKIYYYCGVIPFKIIFNQSTGHYQLLKVNRFQMVLLLLPPTSLLIILFIWFLLLHDFLLLPGAI